MGRVYVRTAFLFLMGCYDAIGAAPFDFTETGDHGGTRAAWDQYSDTRDLPYSFTFAGNDYTSLRISDNGAVSFAPGADSFLNTPSLSPDDQWIAVFGADLVEKPPNGRIIWGTYLGNDSRSQRATELVRKNTGSDGFEADYLTVVTWQDVWDKLSSEGLSTFQLAITRSESESYVIFLYETLQTQSDITVGISLGDGSQKLALLWGGATPPDGCGGGESVTVVDLAQRSQTACGTDAGVFVFAVHDSSTFNSGSVCTHVPQSGCSTGTNPAKLRRCQARRKRSSSDDL